MRLVLVDWVDSQGGGGWKTSKDALRDAHDNTMTCATAGWLVEETDGWLLVATSTGIDGQVCDVMQIPRVAVTRVRTLTPGRTRR